MQRFNVDEQKCVGCRICELACSFQRQQEFNPASSNIKIYFADDGRLSINVQNCDCTRPLCLDLCPVQALRPTWLCLALNKLHALYSSLQDKSKNEKNRQPRSLGHVAGKDLL